MALSACATTSTPTAPAASGALVAASIPPSFIPATAAESVRYRDASLHVGDPIITYDAYKAAGQWRVHFRCADSYRCADGAMERSASYVLMQDDGAALDTALDTLARTPSQPLPAPGLMNGRTEVLIRRGGQETRVSAYIEPFAAITRVRDLLASGLSADK